MKPKCLLRLGAETFGSTVACRGEQVAVVVVAIERVRPDLVWYVSDVQTNGPPLVKSRRPMPELIGDTKVLASAAQTVTQFESGVFAGVSSRCLNPRFRSGGLWTEDEEAADLGDVLVELRAFDATYISVATNDVELAERIAKELGGVWASPGAAR